MMPICPAVKLDASAAVFTDAIGVPLIASDVSDSVASEAPPDRESPLNTVTPSGVSGMA
jgi:hypothetical protein